MSRSSIKGALASIAASVTGVEISWFDPVGVWWFGGRLERVLRKRKEGEEVNRGRKCEIVRTNS